MQKIRLVIAAILLLFLGNSTAQTLQQAITNYVSSYADTGDFSGCILIDQDGKTIFRECFGKANLGFNVPNTTETRFMIGSVSKQFTAAAILKLQEMGSLQTGDPLLKFFPNYDINDSLTIHHLLSHRSGLADIYNVPGFNTLSCSKNAFPEIVAGVLGQELQFVPGTQYQYSNGNFAVLAALIEKVSGASYGEFIQNSLLNPLGMENTGHPDGNSVVPLLADGYEPEGYDRLRPTDYLDPSLLKGGGSLFSTVDDLLLWINQLRDKSLLQPVSYEQMFTNHGSNYGYGISVYSFMDQEVFGHDGRLNGYIADYLHYRDTNTSIIVLGNIQTGVSDFFRGDLAAIVFGKDYASRAKSALPLTDIHGDIVPFLGTYSFGPNFKVYIEEIDEKLMARANEGGYSQLVPLENGQFFSRTLYAYIGFKEISADGYTKLVWTTNDGNSFEGIRE